MIADLKTLAWKIQSNVECFGEYEAARMLRRKVSFAAYYFARFGRMPRK